MICRHCQNPLTHTFLDLGTAPPSNSYLDHDSLREPEVFYPLKVYVCERCWLAQTLDVVDTGHIFTADYAYFSSVSTSWLRHAEEFASSISDRLGLNGDSRVVEIGSNDGYLLRNFVRRGIECLGIEPTESTAAAARKQGIPVLQEFFTADVATGLATQCVRADLIVGNNVYAHVPDINNFTDGLRGLLKDEGTVTLEFPHLLRMIEGGQFDTVYHEHFSYLSLHAVAGVFKRAGLRIYDVDQLPTHGGSLRLYGCRQEAALAESPRVAALLQEEREAGLLELTVYSNFQSRVNQTKDSLLDFLLTKKREGRTVAAYGAAAKGTTLLNYAGVKADLLPFVCDRSPSKQGKFLPGCRIPIFHPDILFEREPDVILVLPWNIAAEVRSELASASRWGARFATAVPRMNFTS